MAGVDPNSFCGLPWEAWTNALGSSVASEKESTMEMEEYQETSTPGVVKLPKKDMKIFGLFPETDAFTVVVCEICKMCVKQQALAEHYERRHSSTDTKPVLLPITERTVVAEKSSTKLPKTPSTKDKRKKVTNKETNNKEKDVLVVPMPKLQSLSLESVLEGVALPPLKVKPLQPANAAPSATSKVRTVPLKQREYNPDKHCGVISMETLQPCTWSLTCKSHAVSLRRAVPGRSKPFNQLLEDQRRAKEMLTKQKKSLDATSVSPASQSPQSLTSPLPKNRSLLRPNVRTSLATRFSSSFASPVSRGVLLDSNTSPITTPPPSAQAVDVKQEASWDMDNLGVEVGLSCRPPAKRIRLSSPPSPSGSVFVTMSSAYLLEPPRPLSVAMPLFCTRKVGGLVYNKRRMQTVRQGLEARLNSARNYPRF